ncbi:MAG: metal ABC transporter ATP-binding protein [bacterium]
MPNAIELEDVWVNLGDQRILKGITLKIQQPSCVVVVGPNGAGKTTLLRLLCGLIHPSKGKISIFRTPLNSSNMKSLRKTIAYLPQDLNVDPHTPITAEEVVAIGKLSGMKLGWQKRESDRNAIEEAIKVTGISHIRKRPFALLSAGQKQRTNLARALAQQAIIMLLDEPLSNLDPDAQQDICTAIDEIYARSQVVIILVTHLIEKLPRCCNRVLAIEDGKISKDMPIVETYQKGVYANNLMEG